MCGRFVSKEVKEILAKLYQATVITPSPFAPSYNVAPTEFVPIIRETGDQERELLLGRFGIPMTGGGKSFPLLNIQSEKAANREEFKSRRCVIPANGFFEWEKLSPKEKQPYYFSPRDGLFSFAGVWRNTDKGTAFSILTTAANEVVAPIHSRMPVILGPNAVGEWLASNSDVKMLAELMGPYLQGLMQSWKVSTSVNAPKNKDADLINSA